MRFIKSSWLVAWGLVAVGAHSPLYAQRTWDKECETTLDDAKMYYNEGMLETVVSEDGIKDCLNRKGALSREKRLEGYRLLTEAYLFKNDIDEADLHFKEVLRLNPLYRVDSTDPTASFDLIYLARTYRRKPIISTYAGVGANYSRINVLQWYGTDHASAGTNHTSYSNITVGFNGSVGIEVPVWRNFDFAMDVNFALRTYLYVDSLYSNAILTDARENEAITSVGPDQNLRYGEFNFRENQFWIDIPVMARYNFGEKKIIPYIYAGANANFLLKAGFLGIRRTTVEESDLNAGNQVEEILRIPITDFKEKDEDGNVYEFASLRNRFNFSVVAGAGVKIRVGRDFIFADARYTRFFFNMVNDENRYSRPNLLYRFNYVDNDFLMDNVSLTVGFMKSFYTPKKKRAYDEAVMKLRFDRELLKQRQKLKTVTNRVLRDEINASIRNLEQQQRSVLNDVKWGRTTVEQSIQKAKELQKGKILN